MTFHARIFQPPVEAAVPVQPIALRYARAGALAHSVPFRVEEGFLSNFLRLLGESGGDAEVHFLPVVPVAANARRALAELSKNAISRVVGANLEPQQDKNRPLAANIADENPVQESLSAKH